MPLQKMQNDGTFVPWHTSKSRNNASTVTQTSTTQRSSVAALGQNMQSHAGGAQSNAADLNLLQSIGQQLTISENAITYPLASVQRLLQPPPLVAPQPAPFPALLPLKTMRRSSTTTQSKASSRTSKKNKSKTRNATVVEDPDAMPTTSQSTPSGVAPPAVADPAPAPATVPAPTMPPQPKKRRARKKDLPAQPVAGSSSQVPSQVQASTRTPAKPEKRKARFRAHPPQRVLERVHRVLTQRFFMIDRKRETGRLAEEFKVLGSTGNVYTVVIDHLPRCDCPDAARGNHCKHIMFVFLKVLHVPQSSGHWYQKALLTSELESVFNDAPIAPNSVSSPRLQAAYAQATGQVLPSSSKGRGKRKRSDDDDGEAGTGKKRRVLTDEDDCPVCYETMGGAKESDLVWCDACRNAVHSDCWSQWQRSARSRGNGVTCVYCRAKWAPSTATAAAKSGPSRRWEDGRHYLNLADAAGLGPMQRDTSTYHRYGYDIIEDPL